MGRRGGHKVTGENSAKVFFSCRVRGERGGAENHLGREGTVLISDEEFSSASSVAG